MSVSFSKSLSRWLEALAATLFYKGVKALSTTRASALGGALFRVLGPKLGPSRVARKNLQRAFPDQDITPLVARIWDNLGQTFFEYPHLRKMVDLAQVDIVGGEYVQALIDQGQGGLIFSGHMANWEILAMLPEKLRFDAGVMYRAPNNPKVSEILSKCRLGGYLHFIPKSTEGTKEAFSILSNKGFVGMLIDHRYNRGIEVDFLGGRAVVAPTIALMAQRYGCPLVPVRVERLGPLHYRLTVQEPLVLDRSLPKEESTRQIMQQAMSIMDGWIRERPDQWFWMQKLWR